MERPAPSVASVDGDPLEWSFLQCFGERSPGEDIQEADVISAVEFDWDGRHLATGDRGGRVVLFEQVPTQARVVPIDARTPASPASRLNPFEYRYTTEFQSHEPEFDYLKSLEIEEKINQVRWVNQSSRSRLLLSTNDKTIKLWRVYEKRVRCLTNLNLGEPRRGAWQIAASGGPPLPVAPALKVEKPARKLATLTDQKLGTALRVPKVASAEPVLTAQCRRAYANAHTYHVNSIALSSDRETFISADDLRINLWHLEVSDRAFNVVDIKPPNMEDLTEVITSAEFHPIECHTFAFASSKGCIRLADLRANALADRAVRTFEEEEAPGARSFFSEIISSISDLRFSRDGRHLLARDYMTLKLWDVRMEHSPLSVMPVHEPLRQRLCDLYENDCIFDKFDCCLNGRGDQVATGTYSNCFRLLGTAGGGSGSGGGSGGGDMLLEASRDPQRRRLQSAKSTPSRFGLARGGGARRHSSAGADAPAAGAEPPTDFGSKLLHLAWHPEANVIAAAASNSLYMYCAR
ncbi:hypothetical protein WJX81_004778 [Elliptochloris bilobata]|uniref:Serine/threonine-protein phosphatase 2A 55 kDa regulatory subunit B n=1 Tax=Elliptochloris bilobata TaxID=381761 RepID=A0AAW1RCC8_9CHLO